MVSGPYGFFLRLSRLLFFSPLFLFLFLFSPLSPFLTLRLFFPPSLPAVLVYLYSNSLTRTRICGTPRLSDRPPPFFSEFLSGNHGSSQAPPFLHDPAQFLSYTCPFFSFVRSSARSRSLSLSLFLAPTSITLLLFLTDYSRLRLLDVVSPYRPLSPTTRSAESRALNRRSYFVGRLLVGLTPRRRGNKFRDPPITPGPSFVRSFLDLNVRAPASFAAPPRALPLSLSLSLSLSFALSLSLFSFFCLPLPPSLSPALSGVERLLKIDDPPALSPRRRPTFAFSPVPISEKRNGRESGFDYPKPGFTRFASHVPSLFTFYFPSLSFTPLPIPSLCSVDFVFSSLSLPTRKTFLFRMRARVYMCVRG